MNNPVIYIAALGPAIYFGLHNYSFVLQQATHVDIPSWAANVLAIVAGIASAMILELAGVKAGTLIFRERGWLRVVSCVMFVAYAAIAVTTVVGWTHAAVATVIVAVLYYLAHGVEDDMVKRHEEVVSILETTVSEQDKRHEAVVAALQGEIVEANLKAESAANELQTAQQNNQRLTNKIEQLRKAKPVAKKRLNGATDDNKTTCKWCNKPFSKRGLNAHQYRCELKPLEVVV